jgi:molybdopterin-guanine dinucleotide biosynthesis protein B
LRDDLAVTRPFVFGVTGWKNAGKTTLTERLVTEFVRRGWRVSTIKHAHHGFDIDRPGKDSHRHRIAGAREVLVASPDRWALLHEHSGAEPALTELLARLAPVDLVLVEGFKHDRIAKIEVHRPALGREPLWPADPDVVAVASDAALADCGRCVLPLGDPAAIAAWLGTFLLENPLR